MTIAAMIRTRFDCAIPGTPVRYALGTQQAGKKPTRANSRRSLFLFSLRFGSSQRSSFVTEGSGCSVTATYVRNGANVTFDWGRCWK